MKSKLYSRILCIVLAVTIVGSILLVAIPMFKGNAAVTPVKGAVGHITDDYVNLRSGAGTGYSAVTTMRINTKVTFQDGTLYNKEWYKIQEQATNKTGYVRKDFVTADSLPASSIKINAASVSTYVGCQYAFSQTGASNPKWTSSNTSVATIDANGVLTAKAAGTTTVTVSSSGESATCKVTVLKGTPTGISKSSMTVYIGKTATLTAATSGVKWYSSNKNVATVSNGVVTAKDYGYATISAYTSSGASTCLVKVTDPPQSTKIKLSSYSPSTFTGCQYAFGITGASNPVWESSDTSVASVDSNGVVTAKKAGKTTISATEGGEIAYCTFTVVSGGATGISESSLSLITGTTAQLSATTSGVKWYSTNTAVATVSGGLVTAKSEGYAAISAYTSAGASTCLIHVTDKALQSDIVLSSYQITTYAGCQYALWQTGAANPVWSSSDPGVASVDANGIITAAKAGMTTVTATENGKVSSCKVIVKAANSTGISNTGITLDEGNTVTLTAKTSGVSWFSSNKNVATVSGGKVTAKSEGYATVSAYTVSGASTCLVHVVKPEIVEVTGYITEDGVNLRNGAGTNYSVLKIMSKNTPFTFISEILYNTSWYHIRLENGTTGYVIRDYVSKPAEIKLTASSVTTYSGCQYALGYSGVSSVVWSSSNTSVATIDENGVITAKAAGTTTVSAVSGNSKSTCKVTVKSGSSTGISKTSLTLEQGKTASLTAKTSGVKWFSSNKDVATVSNGVVTAKNIGYATISAYTASGASTCLVQVTESSTGTIKLSAKSATTYVGCQYAIGLTGVSKASWSSSNTYVATVDANGVVTAKAAGTATIKASNAASSATCVITVKSGYATGISASGVTVPAGKSILLKSDTSSVKWYSSNSAVATVSSGIVDTKKSGYVTISAYTSSGASTCLIHVTAPDNIRFVYATPNSAPRNSTVTFKAITDQTRTAVKFEVTNGSTSYTVNATSKVADGNTYVWTGSRTLSTSGKWTVTAYSKTSTTDYATTSGNGSGEVFVTNSTDTTTTVAGERRASDEIIALIANYEGFLSEVEPDSITSDPTLGYGKVVTKNEQFYNHLTQNEAYAYLCQTVNAGGYTTKTNEFLTSNNIKFNQRQFDALVCFAYNVGAYTIYNDATLQNVLLNTTTDSGSTAVKAGGSGYVNASGVNLRSGPGTGNSVVTTMSQNTSFTFVDAKLYNSTWYWIKLSNGTTGYIHSDYASVTGSATRDLDKVNRQQLTARFLQYHHAAGSCYWGLLYRRIDEMEIFFYGDYARDGQNNKYKMYYRCVNNPSFGIG